MAVKLNEWWDNFLFGTEAEKEAVKQAQDNLYAAKLEKKRLLGELNKAATEEERMRTRNLIDAQNKIIDESTATMNQRKGFVPKAGDVAARTMESTGRGMSRAFAQGISDWAANQSARGTTAPDRASAHLQQQATMHDIQAGDLQKAQQQSQQIADRDYHAEAEKNAVAGAATENAQRVQNLSASAGAGAAALNRQVKSADYNTMMNRADTQRDKAVERGKEAWDVRQQAERERAGADKADYAAREAETDNRRAANLSYGTGVTWDDASYNINTAPKPKEPATSKPKEPEPKQEESRPEKSTQDTTDGTQAVNGNYYTVHDMGGNQFESKQVPNPAKNVVVDESGNTVIGNGETAYPSKVQADIVANNAMYGLSDDETKNRNAAYQSDYYKNSLNKTGGHSKVDALLSRPELYSRAISDFQKIVKKNPNDKKAAQTLSMLQNLKSDSYPLATQAKSYLSMYGLASDDVSNSRVQGLNNVLSDGNMKNIVKGLYWRY